MLSSSCSKKPESARWRRARLVVALAGLLVSSLCAAADWRAELPRAMPLGDGELSWLGMRIYHATLWAEQRPFQREFPFALQLRYYRSISRQRLARTSMDEIVRLSGAGIDAATLAQWENTLERAFIDVAPGDELIGVHTSGRGMRLYDRRGLLAEIDDTRLARAFFAIWLDEGTRDQGLRRKLLGESP